MPTYQNTRINFVIDIRIYLKGKSALIKITDSYHYVMWNVECSYRGEFSG